MTTKLLSIIIPVYNEKPNIYPSTSKLIEEFSNFKDSLEILFVDDNSPDGTAEEINRVNKEYPQVKLIQNGKKEGIGAAHKAGYRASKGDYILCIDADLSQSPKDLLKIKNKLDEGYDLAIGSRYMDKGKQFGKSPIRDMGSRGMNLMCRYILGIKLTDCTHTFRGFKRELFEEFSHRINSKGHPSFQVEFSFFIFNKGSKTIEIPIHFTEREEGAGVSKISIRKEVPPFMRTILRLLKVRLFG
jgi:glycosyltransferase involved in cell wall biosynthesis